MDTFPTADEVAHAIVAACRETGEDPIVCASRLQGNVRARHYAMHALRHVFFQLAPDAAARLVGCTGNPGTVFAVSRTQCFRKAGWWNEQAYCRIVFAIQQGKTPEPEPPPYKPGPLPAAPARRQEAGTMDADGYRPPVGTIQKVLDDERQTQPTYAPGKRALYDMLAEAVKNTAKLPRDPE